MDKRSIKDSHLDRIVQFFQYKHPQTKLIILKGSENKDIDEYLIYQNAEASTTMDIDGNMSVIISSIAGKAAIYEELGHVLQFINDGNITTDCRIRFEREIEVAQCLVNSRKNNLTQEEYEQTLLNLEYYEKSLEALSK